MILKMAQTVSVVLVPGVMADLGLRLYNVSTESTALPRDALGLTFHCSP